MKRVWVCVFALLLTTACDKSKESPSEGPGHAPSKTPPTALLPTAQAVLEELATLEAKRDVTCWTSFRQLDWYIAEKSYSEFATLAKIGAVKALVRAVWVEASGAATSPEVRAQDIQAVVKRLPQVKLGGPKKGQLESFANDIGLQNFTDYQKTAEHLRVLLAVIQDEIYLGGPLKPLDSAALKELADAATTLSLMLLKESSSAATAGKSELIEGEHVRTAFESIRKQYDLKNTAFPAKKLGFSAAQQSLAPLTKTLLEGKARALAQFNKGSKSLTEDLNRVARVPLTPEATKILRLRLQSFAHFVAAGFAPMRADNYLDDGSYARTKMERRPYVDHLQAQNVIMQLFPHHTMNNGDVIVRFEPSPGPIMGRKERKGYELRMLDHEMNGVRDSAIHWMVLATVWQEKAFAMDPFAAEYLSEVISMMMTMYLRQGELLAKEMGKTQIDAEVAGRIHDRSLVMVPPHQSARVAWGPEQAASKKRLLARYPKTLYADVTAKSGLPTSLPRFGKGDAPLSAAVAKAAAAAAAEPQHVQKTFNLQRIMGGGIAVGDINSDGYPDLFLTGEDLGKLYVNRGKSAPGTFIDATAAWSIPSDIDDGHGTLFFDLEGDGDLDLLVLRSQHPALLLRQEDGKFSDVAKSAGLSTHAGAHAASVFDYDGDGDLDIYVGYYGSHSGNMGEANKRSLPSLDGRNGSPNQLWQQQDDGRFVNIAKQAGVADTGWALAAGAFDHDLDGDTDLYVANDFGANRFFENNGDGTFADITDKTHTGDRGSGMNVSVSDINRDGRWDFYVTNIDMFSKRIKIVFPRDESTIDIDESLTRSFQYLSGNKLYVSANERDYRSEEAKRFEPGDRGWGWDASFFDYENDGDDDIYIANGWVNGSYAGNQKNQLFLMDDETFYRGPDASPEAFAGNTRSVASVDLDRDGDMDLVANQFRQPPRVLRNDQKTRNNWIQVRLRDRGKNTRAIGARVEVTTPAGKTMRHMQAGRGYLSQSDTVVTAGLGKAKKAQVTVIWPDGSRQAAGALAANRLHEIRRAAD